MRLTSIVIEPRYPGPGPNGCWPITDGKVTARGNASTTGEVGAIQICVKCYDATLTAIPLEPEAGSTCLPLLPTGQTYPVSWEVPNVPVATLTGRNIIVAWFKFAGSTTPWAFPPEASLFFPCPPSGSGSGEGIAALGVSATPREEVAPPRQFVADVTGGSAPIALNYDEYCSTPEQPIWSSPVGSPPYTLKVCRYGDRLLGLLADRSAHARVWISDDFNFAATNALVRENDKSSLAHVRPV